MIRCGITRRNPHVRTLGGAPTFSLPLADAGAGAVNLAPSFSAGSPTPTFTRATTAWTKLSSGLWAQVASGVARSGYLGADTAVGAYGGYLAEEARTNECLQARDFTNASWTKSNVTAAKDQAGIDGVAASASSLTATAANGTVKQSITSASAARRFSVFVKRITGTGNIDLTLDNGTTWTTISGSINSATFTRVAIGQTVTNPTVGIRIVTSGDKIAVDMAQEEVGTFDTSPIPTTTATVTRNADALSFSPTGNVSGTAGTLFAQATLAGTANGPYSIVHVNGGITSFYAAPSLTARDGTNVATAGALVVGTTAKAAAIYGGSVLKAAKDGVPGANAAFDGDMNVATLGIGHTNGTNQFNGMLKNVCIWTRALSDSELAAL